MRPFALVVLTCGSLVAAVVPASSQAAGPDPRILMSVSEAVQPVRRLSIPRPDEILQHVMSFDGDADGRITGDELPERMQGLIARIDINQDGTLDPVEIRSSVDTRFAVRTGNVIVLPNSDAGLAGVINDLKLAPQQHEQALAIVSRHTVPRNVNDPASVDLYARMRELLDDEEYENFVAAARRLTFSRVAVGGVVRGVVGGIPPAQQR